MTCYVEPNIDKNKICMTHLILLVVNLDEDTIYFLDSLNGQPNVDLKDMISM